MLKARKGLNFPTPPLFEAPARGNPLECEEIMTLAFSVLTQYRRVTEGNVALASSVARVTINIV